MKRYANIFFILVGLIPIVGCGSGDGPLAFSEEEQLIEEIESSKATISLSDAPSDDFESVEVDIESPLTFIDTSDGMVAVPLPDDETLRVDLLSLNGISAVISRTTIPPGTYKKIQIKVANPKIILSDGPIIPSNEIHLVADGLVQAVSQSNFTITPNQPISLKLDFDVAKSVRINAANGKYILRPQIFVEVVTTTTPSDEVETEEAVGRIVRIPGIQGDPDSFLLRLLKKDSTSERKLFVQVDVTDKTTILTHAGTSQPAKTFSDLAVDQFVEVGGVMTDRGVIQAKTVMIFPREKRGLRGQITELNNQTFQLRRQGQPPVLVSYAGARVRLSRPPMDLVSNDLANGQQVILFGEPQSPLKLTAQVIMIHPERFQAFVVETSCNNNEITVVSPFKRLTRLNLVSFPDPDLPPIVVVNLTDATFLGKDREAIGCDSLKKGAPIRITGRLIASTSSDSNKVQIKAITVRQVALTQVKGTIQRVNLLAQQFVLRVPLPTTREEASHFDRPDGCVALEGYDCSSFHLTVKRLPFVHNPDGILFDDAAVDQDVVVEGVFSSRPLQPPILLAMTIRK